MNDHPSPASPAGPGPQFDLDALSRLVEEAIEDLRGQQDADRSDMLVFVSGAFDAFPQAVIMDNVLEPVDKLVWMLLACHARTATNRTVLPPQDILADQVNVATRGTVYRALTMLRITRWLTLCAGPRHAMQRAKRNVYALSHHPLSLSQVLTLDRTYPAYVEKLCSSRLSQARRLAIELSASLEGDLLEQPRSTTDTSDNALVHRRAATLPSTAPAPSPGRQDVRDKPVPIAQAWEEYACSAQVTAPHPDHGGADQNDPERNDPEETVDAHPLPVDNSPIDVTGGQNSSTQKSSTQYSSARKSGTQNSHMQNNSNSSSTNNKIITTTSVRNIR